MRRLGDAPDEPARGAKLGDRHELVGVRGKGERDVGHRLVWGGAGRLECPEVGNERCRERGQLLGLARAGLVINRAVGAHGLEPRLGRAPLDGERHRLGERLVDRRPKRSEARHRADGIEVEETSRLPLPRAGAAHGGEEMARGLRPAEPGRELNGCELELDAGKNGRHVVGAPHAGAELTWGLELAG